MFDDFVPTGNLEKAFMQASGWGFDKLWNEADQNGEREDWNKFFGQSACLCYHCALDNKEHHLKTVTSAMQDCLGYLDKLQQQSLCRTLTVVAAELLNHNLPLESTELRLILRVACNVLLNPDFSSAEYCAMNIMLKPLLGHAYTKQEIEQLTYLCEKSANEIHLLEAQTLAEERAQASRVAAEFRYNTKRS